MLKPYQRILSGQLEPVAGVAQRLPDPVAVGAVGGSGTRVVADILRAAGLAMGTPLNNAGDAAEWPPFRKLLAPAQLAEFSREQILGNALQTFEALLLSRRDTLGLNGRAGWKVPGTFHWLRELGEWFPRLQYVHLIRHGLDMAYSSNRSPVNNWAAELGIEVCLREDGRVHPRTMLDYWLRANQRAFELGRECLGDRFYLLRFEELCEDPRASLAGLFGFLGLDPAADRLLEFAAMVKAPRSIGRYRDQDWQRDFSDGQLAQLEDFGYSAQPPSSS